MLTWQISPKWVFDPDLVTEVEVRFGGAGPHRTRVELEHRNLERMGAAAEEMRATFESPTGWAGILERFAQVAQG